MLRENSLCYQTYWSSGGHSLNLLPAYYLQFASWQHRINDDPRHEQCQMYLLSHCCVNFSIANTTNNNDSNFNRTTCSPIPWTTILSNLIHLMLHIILLYYWLNIHSIENWALMKQENAEYRWKKRLNELLTRHAHPIRIEIKGNLCSYICIK